MHKSVCLQKEPRQKIYMAQIPLLKDIDIAMNLIIDIAKSLKKMVWYFQGSQRMAWLK